MSVQETPRTVETAKESKNSESLSRSKKRKHDTDYRESSKKKKKPRTDRVADKPVTDSQQLPQIRSKEKKKKKKRATEDSETTVQSVDSIEDVELPVAPAAADGREEETGAPFAVDFGDDVEGAADSEEHFRLKLLESEDPSSFYSTRLSLYVSIPAIALETGTSSILATHLAPLLLTYFPPAQGIVLAFSDPVLSAKPNSGTNLPLLPPRTGDLTPLGDVFAETADEYGACWVWLTITFLVFRPQSGDELHGWTNVTSEGFVGLVSYNYFQTAVSRSRLPSDWKWSGPSKEEALRNRKKGRKGRLRGDDGPEDVQENDTQETDTTLVETPSSPIPLGDDGGYFAGADGSKIKSTLQFRVVDTEIVPAYDRHKWSVQIDGTLLDEDAEKRVVEEERMKFERAQERSRSRSPGASEFYMSGALRRPMSREGSVASRLSGQTPARLLMTY